MNLGKRITICAFIFTIFNLLPHSILHTQLAISDAVSVTAGNDEYGYWGPKLAVNGDDDLFVFWSKPGVAPSFYLSKLTDGSFEDPITIPLNGLFVNLWYGNLGPGIATFDNYIYAVFEVYGDAIYCVRSADGGESWDNPVVAYTPATNRRATIPNISVNSEGHPYISYVNTDSQEENAHYGFVKSSDFGLTFGEESIVNELVAGEEACECCNGHMEIDESDNVYVGFRNNNNGLRDCWIARSVDGGDSFSEVYDVDPTDWILNGCPNNGPDFDLFENKVITTFFSSGDGFDPGIYHTSLNLETGNTSVARDIASASEGATNQTAARIAVGDNAQAIVFQELFQLETDISMTLSLNGPSNLGATSFHLNNSAGSQRQPDVLYFNNAFHVVYEDISSATVMYQSVEFDDVSIEENDTLDMLTFYPNPTKDVLIPVSNYEHVTSLRITDSMGRSALNVKINSDELEPIDVSSLSSGIYYVIMDTSRGLVQKRFVKE